MFFLLNVPQQCEDAPVQQWFIDLAQAAISSGFPAAAVKGCEIAYADALHRLQLEWH